MTDISSTLVEQHPFAQLANEKFREENDIAWHNIILTPNKPENPGKPKNMEPELVVKVVKLMMDSKNRPTLIHCNKGKVSISQNSDILWAFILTRDSIALVASPLSTVARLAGLSKLPSTSTFGTRVVKSERRTKSLFNLSI